MNTLIKLLLTLAILATAGYFGYNKYEAYIENPWTRDGQVRTQVIQITPRVSGMVVKIHVQDNQFVKKGAPLFDIDPSQYQVKLDQSQARLQRTLEAAKGTKIEYERVEKIYKRDKGAVSQKDLVRNQINYYKSLADIDSSTEQVNSSMQEITSSISEVAKSSQSLAKVSEDIKKLVDMFKV